MYMFTMMNMARLNVGLQGIAISERAYQKAREYARERVQGTAPGVEGRATIIHHADVRRMLMLMKAATEATRALAYVTFATMDFALRADDPEVRARHQTRVDLLTPVVKGWSTELAQEVTSLGVQIHGGMGYIEETGAAQHFRDARIATIYEGTTGIQALDLVGRKTIRDSGKAQRELLDEMKVTSAELAAAGAEFAPLHRSLASGIAAQEQALAWLLDNYLADPQLPGSVAFDMLMLLGTVSGGWQMCRAALAARRALASGPGDASYMTAKLATASFYASHIMPRAQAHLQVVLAGSAGVVSLTEEQF
jgi:acyl-CoA dehydrogenase